MGLLSRKQKVHLDVFCREFYDKLFFFNPVVAGVDVGDVYYETLKRSISEVDEKFAVVDPKKLSSEMMLIRYEVFGLAWLHQFGDKHAVPQSAFTKSYLAEQGREDIWNALEPYNQAIARSSTLGQTGETAHGRAYLTLLDRNRMHLFERGHSQGIDPEAVARAANRIFTDVSWKDGLTGGFLMLTLCEHLGCDVSEQEAQVRLVAIIRELYEGFRGALKLVKVKA